MSEKPQMTEEKKQPEVLENTETENPPVSDGEEERGHANYRFAFKVIAVLLAIILIIVILKASGVPVAIRDWFSDKSAQCVAVHLLWLF